MDDVAAVNLESEPQISSCTAVAEVQGVELTIPVGQEYPRFQFSEASAPKSNNTTSSSRDGSDIGENNSAGSSIRRDSSTPSRNNVPMTPLSSSIPSDSSTIDSRIINERTLSSSKRCK